MSKTPKYFARTATEFVEWVPRYVYQELWDSHEALAVALEQANKVWSNLSAAVGCSSPDGSAELGQVETCQREREAALAAVKGAKRVKIGELRWDEWLDEHAPIIAKANEGRGNEP